MFVLLSLITFLQRTFIVMGTEMTVRIAPSIKCSEELAYKLAGDAYKIVRSIETKMSGWKEGSYTYLINKYAGIKAVKVSENYLHLIKDAFYIYNLTTGVFDITACPLINAVRKKERRTSEDVIGMDKIIIKKNTVFLPQKSMCIDVDGILKGFAIEKVYSFLSKSCNKFYIEVGGDVCGMNFETIIPYGNTVYSLHIQKGCIATSGIHPREYVDFVNPLTGKKEFKCKLASVYHKKGSFADALATYLLITGRNGFKEVKKADGEGLCISDKSIHYTDGFKKLLSNHP